MSSEDCRNNTRYILGSGSRRSTVVGCAILAITLFFYIYFTGSFFQIHVYSLFKRVTYEFVFNIHIINRELDNVVVLLSLMGLLFLFLVTNKRPYWLVIIQVAYISISLYALYSEENFWLQYLALLSLPLVIFLFYFYNYKLTETKAKRAEQLNLVVNYFLLICIVFGIIGLIIVSVRIIQGGTDLIPIRNYMYEIYLLFSNISPYLVFILTLCVPIKLIINKMRGLKTNGLRWIENPAMEFNGEGKHASTIPHGEKISSNAIVMCLFLCILLSVLLIVISHWSGINSEIMEQRRIIGSDTANYAYTLRILQEQGNAMDVIRKAFLIGFGSDPASPSGDRPLTLLFLLSLVKILPFEVEYVVDNASLILAPLLIMVIFFLTRELTFNDKISILAAFLTCVSFNVLVGIYGGYYANWFGLVWGYLSLIFLVRSLRRSQKWNFALYIAFTSLTMLSHIYTWIEFLLFEGIFLTVLLFLKYFSRRRILYLFICLFVTPSVYLVILAVSEPYSSTSEGIFNFGQGLGVAQFVSRWESLTQAIHIENGGLFASFIILGLATYWVFICNTRDLSTIFLMTLLCIGIIPIFFGNYIIQGRVLYNFPFQIPAAIGLFLMQRNKLNGKIVFVAICIWLIVIGIRSAENFILVPPYMG